MQISQFSLDSASSRKVFRKFRFFTFLLHGERREEDLRDDGNGNGNDDGSDDDDRDENKIKTRRSLGELAKGRQTQHTHSERASERDVSCCLEMEFILIF